MRRGLARGERTLSSGTDLQPAAGTENLKLIRLAGSPVGREGAQRYRFIKDKVSRLDRDDVQQFVAGLLRRAMGYKTRILPSGSDRGKDIVASPDGLGFEDPRIVAEVKHCTVTIGSREIRNFLGGRHDNEKSLYVSTGGFTKDARYEAERARIPLTLMDMDDLVRALLDHYERMDIDMQRLLPLRKL